MPYTKQAWTDGDPATPISGDRLDYIETGIFDARAVADAALAAGGGGRAPGDLYIDDFGGNPNGTADNTAAFNAMVAAVPTTSPVRGATLHFSPGIYNFNSSPTTIPVNAAIKIQGHGGVSAHGLSVGTIIRAGSTGVTLLTWNPGATVRQAGPVLEDICLDGNSLASTIGISATMQNRVRAKNCSFVNFGSYGVYLNSTFDTVAGGDSAWHQFDGCHFYKSAVNIYCRHSFGLQITGGDMIQTSGSVGTHIYFGSIAPTSPGQWLRVFGTKFDSGLIGIDMEGGHSTIEGCGFEECTTGIRVSHVGTSPISGGRSTIIGNGFGALTTAIDVGTGCTSLEIMGNHYTSVTNRVVFADNTARAATLHIPMMGLGDVGNLNLGTMVNAAPADASLNAGQCQVYLDATAAAPKLRVKGKDSAGTVFDHQLSP